MCLLGKLVQLPRQGQGDAALQSPLHLLPGLLAQGVADGVEGRGVPLHGLADEGKGDGLLRGDRAQPLGQPGDLVQPVQRHRPGQQGGEHLPEGALSPPGRTRGQPPLAGDFPALLGVAGGQGDEVFLPVHIASPAFHKRRAPACRQGPARKIFFSIYSVARGEDNIPSRPT